MSEIDDLRQKAVRANTKAMDAAIRRRRASEAWKLAVAEEQVADREAKAAHDAYADAVIEATNTET